MAKGFKHGSGAVISGGEQSSELNFSVKAYASADELPSAEMENTIGVITDVEITSWIFSATEPTAHDEGMVCITTGTSSTVEFNALKKNGIEVYPLSAKQYISGAWVDKTAKSYIGGEWKDWITDGDWIFNGIPFVELRTSGFTYTSQNGELIATASGGGYHNIGFDSDLAKYDTMEIEIWNESALSAHFTIFNANQGNITGTDGSVANLSIPITSGYETYTVPVSALGGQKYQCLFRASGTAEHKIRIKNWRLY